MSTNTVATRTIDVRKLYWFEQLPNETTRVYLLRNEGLLAIDMADSLFRQFEQEAAKTGESFDGLYQTADAELHDRIHVDRLIETGTYIYF
jgi:hypothetical protein